MARTNPTKATGQPSKRKGGGQDTPGRPDAKPIKKVDAAKAAISEGIDSPQSAVAYIAKRYGIEMKPQHFSAVKFQLKRKLEGAQSSTGPELPPKASGAVEGYLAPPPSPRRGTGETDLLDAMETIKTLIAELGTDKVKRIVDLLG